MIIDPAVFAGVPKDADRYDVFHADGIDVYIEKNTASNDGILTITAEDSLWRKILIVKGIAVE